MTLPELQRKEEQKTESIRFQTTPSLKKELQKHIKKVKNLTLSECVHLMLKARLLTYKKDND